MPLLAIVLAIVVATALGMMWFSSLMFGNTWMRLTGIMKPDQMTSAQKRRMLMSYLGNILLTAVTALVVYSLLVTGFRITDLFAIWSAFSLPVFATGVFWGNKPTQLFLIEAGYNLVALAFMAQVIVWVM